MRENLQDSARRSDLPLRSLAGLAAAALLALMPASSAGAAVTIGQLAPNPPGTFCEPMQYDLVQPTVTSGNSYVVPANGTITSWSTNAGGPAMYSMKVFRKVVDPARYQVVAHSGPHQLALGLNTFPASVAVKTGDLLGLNVNDGSAAVNSCTFSAPGDRFWYRAGNLADGESGEFFINNEVRLNASAVFEHSNVFTFGATAYNTKKGTATLTVNLPNPGELTASGKDLNAAGAAVISKAVTPGTASLLIKAKGKKKRKLRRKGKVMLNPAITFTPTGGEPRTESIKLKLKKKL